MNERIQKLKDQCWVEKRWDNDMWIEKHIDQEKFAELIVRECVSVINTEAAEHEDDDEIERAWKMGTEFAVYQIKQHFGVEE